MKKYLSVFISFFFFAAAHAQNYSLYDYSITTIDSQTVSFSDYQGFKIMIIVLPTEQSEANISFLKNLDTLAIQYANQLKIFGVPSVEDGYSVDSVVNTKAWYDSLLRDHVFITKGMYTRKTSIGLQEPLFYWLTHPDENGHFEEETQGVGQKFFTNEQGMLFGVVGPEKELSYLLIQRMLDNAFFNN